MRRSVCAAAAVCLTLAVIGLSLETAQAQKTKGKTRPATTKQLMKGLVAAQCGGLKKSLDAEKADWDAIGLQAALLSEAGYLLLDDGRCPDGDWAKAAKALQTHSAAILELVEKKDVEGTKAAFKTLTAESCAVCHKAHKK